jgi:predicted TIM-barrel fold metal-dependent hydrolase
VREFLLRHQDRVLYGLDMGWDGGHPDRAGLAKHLARLDEAYRSDYRYYAGAGVVEAPGVGPGARCEALALPDAVLEKIFRTNALAWYPQIGGA